MKISVLVATYSRDEYLKNCLDSIFNQIRKPDELIVVYRPEDSGTRSLLDNVKNNVPLKMRFISVLVSEPGVISANNAGMKEVTGDILVFIDDDAVAEKDWLLRIEKHYLENPSVGAVGGRDIIHEPDGRIIDGYTDVVGKLTWYGRFIGCHHLRSDGARYVDVLKGCNMSFRYNLIEHSCDTNFIGDACNYETDICFQIAKKGYKLLYDSSIIVHHFVAPRFLPGGREILSGERLYFSHHNHGYVLLKNLDFFKKIIFIIYFYLIDPLKWLVKLIVTKKSFRLIVAIMKGKIDAVKTYLNSL